MVLKREPVRKKTNATRPDALQDYSALQQFLHNVADGPIYVCTSCHKLEYIVCVGTSKLQTTEYKFLVQCR